MRTTHRSRARRTHEKPHLVLWILAASLVILATCAFFLRAPSSRSVEVSFTDDSAHGMEIVPASCASPPPTAPSNSAGYQLSNGVNNAEVNNQGYNFCVTNSGGPTYFVPVNSVTEVQDFYNAIPRLSGVSQSAN